MFQPAIAVIGLYNTGSSNQWVSTGQSGEFCFSLLAVCESVLLF